MTSRFPGLDSISPRRGRDLCEKNHIAANTVRKPRWPVDSRERQRSRVISRGEKRDVVGQVAGFCRSPTGGSHLSFRANHACMIYFPYPTQSTGGNTRWGRVQQPPAQSAGRLFLSPARSEDA